ncbi:MAG: amylo-alpha-1,6-glucosidase, partial [Rikenellaceae bacterium]|nr:amylo-alpha-1,6-glucosidase [Rikenellaceae bacterium]
IACALPYRMLDSDQMMGVINIVKQHLLTPKGLRTLSPRNPIYVGRYEGNQHDRDSAYHQGTVWVWPLEHYVAACFEMFGKSFVPKAQEILAGFEEDLTTYGIGSIAEIYDADPPHTPRGAVSQAWSVGAILRIAEMISIYKRKRS